MTPRRMLWVMTALLCAGAPAPAQDEGGGPEPPPIAEPLERMLAAPYLTEEERKDRRVFHGLWTESDLDTPLRRTRAALIRGAYHDPALLGDLVAVDLAAEALVARGEMREALGLLEGVETLRAARLRGEALEGLGRFEEATRALEPVVTKARRGEYASGAEIVEVVRGLMVRARVAGQALGGGADFRAMMASLARARDEYDRLYWPAHLAEAELLLAKDNAQEAARAALEALSLNPRCARAWYLLGRLSASGFDFDRAMTLAERLDELAGASEGGEAGASLLGDLLRVRVGLRRRDPEGAQRTVRRLLATAPDHPEARALEAAVAAAAFDLPRAESLVAACDAARPDSPGALLEVGRALSDLRQYAEGAEYLERASRRAPHRAEPLVELGLLQLQAGRDVEGLHALREALALEPFNLRARNSLRLVEALLEYERVESEHFVVRYDPSTTDGVLAREMPPVLERIHARVTGGGRGGIDHEPERKTTIDLMPDHRWFSVRITGVPSVHTMAASTGPVVALESPRVGRGHSVGEYDWPRVLQHEYTHTVTLSRTRNRIPHWFTEAAAVYLEDSPRDEARARLLARALRSRRLFDLDEINVAFVRPKEPSDRAQAYAQGHWMYEYMIEREGTPAVLRLMDLYALGRPEHLALREVFGVGPERFLEEFGRWARERTLEWGLALPEGTPGVSDLLLAEGALQGMREMTRADWFGWLAGTLSGRGPALRGEWNPGAPTDAMLARWLGGYPDHPQILELAVERELETLGGEPVPSMIPVLERWAKACAVCETPHRLLAKLSLDGAGRGSGQATKAAIRHLEFLDAREQHSAAYAVELARRYAALGRWEKAQEKAERATRIAPFDADWRELAATIAIRRKDYATARRHIEALIAFEPDREIHRRRLDALERMEKTAR